MTTDAQNYLPVHVAVIRDIEQVGVRCLDGGKCHHGCTKTCSRKDGCVPLTIAGSYLNDDWSLKTVTPQGTEFCWLVELFLPHGGNSLGFYHTGFTDISGYSRSTRNPFDAKRYTSEAEADRIACKLHSLQGVWRAIEHGFHAAADSGLNGRTEGAIHADVEAKYERERARFRQVVSLMGESDAAIASAMDRLNAAIAVHPDGSLVLTHGPFDVPSEKPEATFSNLIAMWWQDDDYGSQFNELLWERP